MTLRLLLRLLHRQQVDNTDDDPDGLLDARRIEINALEQLLKERELQLDHR